MKNLLALALSSLLLTAVSSYADADSYAAAKSDLQDAQAVRGEWRSIDKATGKKAVSLSKLSTKMDEAVAAGNTDEADRIAAKISQLSKLGQAQMAAGKNAKPFYQN